MKKKMVYLVVCRTNLDDLPLLLTGREQTAIRYAASVPIVDMQMAADLADVDYAGLCNTAIIPFDAKTMRPLGLHIVAEFDDEKLVAPRTFKRLPAPKITKKKWSKVAS